MNECERDDIVNYNITTCTKSLPDDIDLNKLAVSEKSGEDNPIVNSPGAAFDVILDPSFAYLAATSKINLNEIPDYNIVKLITDGFQTVSFSSSMEKIPTEGINNWGVPPYTEDLDKPETLFSNFENSMTWTLSRPSKIFGIELMPNAFGTFTYKVDYFSDDDLVGSITRTIIVPGPPIGPSSQGARLFASISNDAKFNRIVITSLSGNTSGFLVSQIRYQACVEICNVIINDTAKKGTTIPVNCCVSVPGFEVVSVSDNIKANILATCCEVKEGFVCPGIGLIAGVKTADAKIFAELFIPVIIQSGAGGCPPIRMNYTCVAHAVFTIDNVFVSSEIKNCEVLNVSDVTGTGFHVVPTQPNSPHCCVEGSASISAKVSACVMTNSIKVSKC